MTQLCDCSFLTNSQTWPKRYSAYLVVSALYQHCSGGGGGGGVGGLGNCGTRFLGVYLTCVFRQEKSDMKYLFQVVLARIVALCNPIMNSPSSQFFEPHTHKAVMAVLLCSLSARLVVKICAPFSILSRQSPPQYAIALRSSMQIWCNHVFPKFRTVICQW